MRENKISNKNNGEKHKRQMNEIEAKRSPKNKL
jgi:hypothetical protein